MFHFLASIFAKIGYAGTILLWNLGLVGTPTLPVEKPATAALVRQAPMIKVISEADITKEEVENLKKEIESLKQRKASSATVTQPTPIPGVASMSDVVAQSNPNQPTAFSLAGSDILKKVGPATVFILTKTGCGTGFIIDKTGLALTNAHVVRDERNFQISFANGIKTNAELVGSDGPKDIALIKINGSNLPFLELGSSDPYMVSAGDDIFAVGYPGIADLVTCDNGQELTIVKGIINARRIVNAVEYFQIDALIQHGNSGGPLVNKYSQVIGINRSGFTNGGFSNGVNFALTINLAKDLLPKLKQGLFVPTFGSEVEIPKNVKLRADYNSDLDCAVFLGGELVQYVSVCKLYRQYPTQYNWVLTD